MWNGRLVNGTRLPTGTYKFRWVATDSAGNRSYSALYPVGLNGRRAVLKKATKTLTASASRTTTYVGSCSVVRTATDVAAGALECAGQVPLPALARGTRRGDSWTARSFAVNYSWWVLV